MSRIVIDTKAAAERRMKELAKWIEKAPQKECLSCKFMRRFGEYENKFYCDLHNFQTKGHAVCSGFESKDRQSHSKTKHEKRKENGLCVICSKHVERGYITCQKCREKAKIRKYWRSNYD